MYQFLISFGHRRHDLLSQSGHGFVLVSFLARRLYLVNVGIVDGYLLPPPTVSSNTVY